MSQSIQPSAFISSLIFIPLKPSSHRRQLCPRTTLLQTPRPISSSRNSFPPATNLPPKSSLLPPSSTPSPRPPSLLTLFSTIVGICVLIGSVLYKIPQVVRVLRNRSAAGISVLMYALETLGTTLSAVYYARRAFPFSTYGESVFIMGQNVLLMALVVHFQKLSKPIAFSFAVLYALSLTLLYSALVPMRVVMVLQVCSIPILNLARVPQITLNWQRKGTGELSPVTLGLQLLGNLARIFTTLAQVRDPLMFAGSCVAAMFNATLFGQWFFYRNRLKNVPSQIPNA